jgi:membrane-associated phospholipid phosphatase
MDKSLISYVKEHTLVPEIGVLVFIVLAMMALGVFYPSTEMALAFLVILAVINPSVRVFVIDIAPFILLLFTYDTLRNFADNFALSEIHVIGLIRLDRSLFGGTLPSYWIQQHLWNKPYTPLLDMITNALYLAHFLTPLVVSALLWRRRRSEYWAFAFGLLALSYAAFVTFVLFPVAPPWWATRHGFLFGTPVTLKHFVVSEQIVSAGPNPVAAMPSLHTAYPTYIALVCVSVWGRKALPILLLPIAVAFSTFYLGHHWVVDALAGATYAFASFSTVFLWFRRRQFAMGWLERATRRKTTTAIH